MTRILKDLIKFSLSSLGYEVIRKRNVRSKVNFNSLLQQLVSVGFEPNTVFDLGAASGTIELYETFPKAKHILFEPLDEHRSVLEQLKSRFDIELHMHACGNVTGSANFNVHPSRDGSSMLCKIEGSHRDGELRTVTVQRIDDVVDAELLSQPILIKADIQGAELLALQGGERIVDKAEVLILEARLFESYKEAPLFHELDAFLYHRGFVLYDFAELLHRPLDGALMSFDAVYVRQDSFIRQHQSWQGP